MTAVKAEYKICRVCGGGGKAVESQGYTEKRGVVEISKMVYGNARQAENKRERARERVKCSYYQTNHPKIAGAAAVAITTTHPDENENENDDDDDYSGSKGGER